MIEIAAIKGSSVNSLSVYLPENNIKLFGGRRLRCFKTDHEDKTPSGWLYRGKRGFERFHCGGCGFDVDVIGAAQEIHGLDFRGALKHLAYRAGISQGNLTPAEREAALQAKKERERKRAARAAYRRWERQEVDGISFILRAYLKMRANRKTPFIEAELIKLAVLNGDIQYFDYLYYDVLLGNDAEDKQEFYRSVKHAGTDRYFNRDV